MVCMKFINAKATPINDIYHSYHVKAVEFV